MKKYLFAILLLFFIIGCATTPASQPEVILIPTQAATATIEPSPSPTELGIPTSEVIEAATPEPYFRDDFNSELQPGWEWINQKNELWSLLTVPGSLQIDVTGGYVNLGNASNLLLRSVPQGDFQVETKLTFYPLDNDQFAGLILYKSGANFIQAGYSYCAPAYRCTRRGVQMDIYQGGKLLLPLNRTTYEGNEVYLRLVRQGDLISFLVSDDRNIWFRQNTYRTNMVISQVGLVTGQNVDDITVPAFFDFFQVDLLD